MQCVLKTVVVLVINGFKLTLTKLKKCSKMHGKAHLAGMNPRFWKHETTWEHALLAVVML